MENQNKDKGLTRREFLVGAAAGALALAGCQRRSPQRKEIYPTPDYNQPFVRPSATAIAEHPPATETPTVSPTEETLMGDFEFLLGPEEMVSPPGIKYVPDGHISMLVMADGKIRVWLQGGPYSYLLEGDTLDSLGNPRFVFGPEQKQTAKGFEGYASIHSVIPGANKGELYGFYHQEMHPSANVGFPFTAGIGLAVSRDGGINWERKGLIMEGNNPVYPPKEGGAASGVGQPSAIVIENQVHLFFTDWTQPPDAIHLARARIDSVHKPNAWQRWIGGEKKWGHFGSENESQPIINPPELYCALPGVSYNSYLDRFLMTFESNRGFFVATSKDLTHWDKPQLIMPFPQPQFPIETGNTWYSYPTLLCQGGFGPKKINSDRQTAKSGELLFSKGKRDIDPHLMFRRHFKIAAA